MSEPDSSLNGEFQNELFTFNLQIDTILEELKKEIAKLREEEANRLFEQYTTKAIDEKFLRQLSKILICLYGKTDAEKFFMNFVRIKQVRIVRWHKLTLMIES